MYIKFILKETSLPNFKSKPGNLVNCIFEIISVEVFFLQNIWFYFMNKSAYLFYTKRPCLCAPTESTLESFPVKTWPAKPLPGEKDFNFPLPQSILHNLVHPGEIRNYWYCPLNFWTSTPESFDITPVILLRQSLVGSDLYRCNPWRFLSLNIGLNYLVLKDRFSFAVTDFLWWGGNWILIT